MDYGVLLGVIGIAVGVLGLAVATPPFLQLRLGRPAPFASFAMSHEQGMTLLLGCIDSRPVNKLLSFLGVRREGAPVFVIYDIREHGTNRIVVSAFRAMLSDTASHNRSICQMLQPPLPLVYVVVQHDDKNGATVENHAPGDHKLITLDEGEYFVDARIGFQDGVIPKRQSFTIAGTKDGTQWTFRPLPR
ncbi:MAG: hypothetical protein ACREC1_10470 [Methylovirgula sp.]